MYGNLIIALPLTVHTNKLRIHWSKLVLFGHQGYLMGLMHGMVVWQEGGPWYEKHKDCVDGRLEQGV